MARDFSVSLVSVQRQLERFERSGALVCKRQGRTLVYSWNPKSRLAARLRDLVAVVHEGMSLQAKAALYPERDKLTYCGVDFSLYLLNYADLV